MGNSYRTWIRTTWAIAALSAVALLAMIVLSRLRIDWQAHWFYLFFSIPALLFCAIFLPVLYYYRKKYEKGLSELVGGKYLAHWQYDPDEWNRFVEREWGRTKKKAAWYPIGILGGVIVLGYVFKGWGVDEFKVILPWIFGLAVFAALTMLYIGQRAYRRGLEKVGEVFIGESAVQFGATYFTWDSFGTKLGKVELLKGDQLILQFEIRQISRYGSRSSEIRVPVPRDRIDEAEKLVQRFSQ